MNLFFNLQSKQQFVCPFPSIEKINLFTVLTKSAITDKLTFVVNINDGEFISENKFDSAFINFDLNVFTNTYFPTHSGVYVIRGEMVNERSNERLKFCDIELRLE